MAMRTTDRNADIVHRLEGVLNTNFKRLSPSGRKAITDAIGELSIAPASLALPDDVTRLVIAARIVAFEDQGKDAMRELDQASEAFADRVPWDNAPAA